MIFKNITFVTVFFLWLANPAGAQINYEVTTTADSYTPLSGATSLFTGVWDGQPIPVSLGFDFDFFDETYTDLEVSSIIQLDNTGTIQLFTDAMIDRGYVSGTSQSDIRYLIEGAPGNRIAKIEWVNMGFQCEYNGTGSLNDYLNAQVWLHENNSNIDIWMGQNQVTTIENSLCGSPGASVGHSFYQGGNYSYFFLTGNPSNPDTTSLSNSSFTGVPFEDTHYHFTRCDAPDADFEFSVDSDNVVHFEPMSDNVPNYYWILDDTTTSTEVTPSHFYLPGTYEVTLIVQGNCNSDTLTQGLVIAPILSAGGSIQDFEGALFPNPSNGNFVIAPVMAGSESVDVAIYGMTGCQLLHQKISSSATFHLDVPAGMYYCTMQYGDFIQTLPIIVVR